jgi:eukaryotic-like serine/threonine-protein kinase
LSTDPKPDTVARTAAFEYACNEFERAWKSAAPPRIEDFLVDFATLDRAELLNELIRLDIYHRRRKGDQPSAKEYAKRFPELLLDKLEFTLSWESVTPPSKRLGAGEAQRPAPSVLPGLGHDTRIQLREPKSEGSTAPYVSNEGGEFSSLGRLRIDEQIACGGMGVVLRGRDVDLGRDVAVKVLLAAHSTHSDYVQRFVEEAQIAGQLQHPGVIPVYQLGQLPDQRPYFTMKLVKGRTLDELLGERGGNCLVEPGESHPDSLSADLPRFLKIFEQICQAMAYAHSRGVIHRDLKPSNVMVGKFGEVQVMDWGLAKILGNTVIASQVRNLDDDQSTILCLANRDADADRTMTEVGQVMGTLAYMAPEQARGETDRLDERCDVFGLGAILCVILTGQAPYAGTDLASRLDRARRGDVLLALGRLDSCGADAELVRLAKGCLTPKRDDRPRDAGVLAERTTKYLNGVQERLRQAEIDRAAEQARANEARAKAAAEQRARRLTVGLAASVLLLAAIGGGSGWFLQNQRAEHRAEKRRLEIEQRLAVEAALVKVSAMQDHERWSEARAVLEEAKRRLGDTQGDLGQRLNLAEENLDLVAQLDAIRQRTAIWVENHFDYASADRDYAALFRESGLATETEAPEAVAARIRDSGVRIVLVAALDDWAVATDRPDRRGWLLAVARLADPDPDGWRDRFRDPTAWRNRERLEQLANEALKQLADPAAWKKLSPQILVALGNCLSNNGVPAIPMLQAAQARYPADFWLNLTLGTLLPADRLDERVGYDRAALAVRPDAAAAHINLGAALEAKGVYDDAITAYYNAIALDPKNFLAHFNLGNALKVKGQLDDAMVQYLAASELEPKNANVHIGLGVILRLTGQLDAAIVEFRIATDRDRGNALAHNNLGAALRLKGQFDHAVAEFRICIALDANYALAHSNLGAALRDNDQHGEALTECREAVRLDPNNAEARNNLGLVLEDDGQPYQAMEEYERAIKLDPKLSQPHVNMGHLLLKKRQFERAMAEFRQAIKCDLNDGFAYYGLGNALNIKGQFDEAIASYRKAIDLQPDCAEAHCNLGHVLRHLGDFAGALAMLKRGDEIGSKRKNWHYDSAGWVRKCQRLVELDQRLPAILNGEAQPSNAVEQLEFAQICATKKLHAAAVGLYAAAFSADPKLAENVYSQNRYNAACSAALAAAGQGKDADTLKDQERADLRKRAIEWLQADLVTSTKLIGGGEPEDRARIQQLLQHWQQGRDLASLRDAEALAKLPQAEREICRKLWADVATLIEKARAK